jgi:hypothetical protein
MPLSNWDISITALRLKTETVFLILAFCIESTFTNYINPADSNVVCVFNLQNVRLGSAE